MGRKKGRKGGGGIKKVRPKPAGVADLCQLQHVLGHDPLLTHGMKKTMSPVDTQCGPRHGRFPHTLVFRSIVPSSVVRIVLGSIPCRVQRLANVFVRRAASNTCSGTENAFLKMYLRLLVSNLFHDIFSVCLYAGTHSIFIHLSAV